MSCFPLTAPGSFHDTIMAKPLVLTAAMAELALEYAESSSSSAANLPAAELDKVRTYGLSCVLNVFMMVFCSTKNLDAASHHGKKAALYYTEFISQINQDGNSFLKLTPTDAEKDRFVRMSFMVFRTGSVLIVGRCTENQLNESIIWRDPHQVQLCAANFSHLYRE